MDEPKPLRCPSCGAAMRIEFSGPSRDKAATCPHCGTTTDLPDAHGTTQERIVERPGEKIIERRTEWVSQSPIDPEQTHIDSAQAPPNSVKLDFKFDNKTFGSREDLRAYVEKTLPPEAAKEALLLMDSARAGKNIAAKRSNTVSWTFTKSFTSGSDTSGLFASFLKLLGIELK